MIYNRGMNIALFSDCYYPTKNGVVTVVIQLRSILERMGHHVVIVTVENSKLEDSKTGEDTKPGGDPCIFRTPSIPLGLGTDQFIGFPHKKKILKFLRQHKIEIIHSHTEFYIAHAAKITAKALHIPAIVTTHTMWEDFYPYYLPMAKLIPVKLVRKITKRLYKKFYAMINVSKKAQNYFKQPWMLPDTPSAVIPNAIDTSSFENEKDTKDDVENMRKNWGIEKDDVLLLFVGRIGEEKRVFELLNICINVLGKTKEKVKVLFVGNGSALEDMKAQVRQSNLGSSIIFTGFVNWTKLHTYYRMSDIFITASLSEMHSMTILEAMICELPVVVRDDVSYHDTVIDGKNGFLASTDDEMETRIIELIEDSGKRKKFGKTSLKLSQNFSLETHGRKTEIFYEEVLKAYPGPLNEKLLREKIMQI